MINEDSIVEYFNSLNEERRYGKIAEIKETLNKSTVEKANR